MSNVMIVKVRCRDNSEVEVPWQEGQSLMEAIRLSGIDEVLALCGGCCSCGTCHVYVTNGPLDLLPAMAPDEDELLSWSDYRDDARSRLSCQLKYDRALVGFSVQVAPAD